jgi:hypothetical protein
MKNEKKGKAAKKEQGLTVPAPESALDLLRAEYPTEATFNRILLPRLGLVSQDVTEGKGKNMKVVTEAGTFFIERPTEEKDEDGKAIWDREEIGTEAEGIILFQRKQLRYYDEDTEEYTSSPVYDNDDEVVPLFRDKKEVDRGTPKDLQAKFAYTDEKGKSKTKLENNRILYVLYGDEVFQLNLRGTSMFSFFGYARKVTPNTVVTHFSSEGQEKGDIAWNRMEFEAVRQITKDEAETVLEKIKEIKAGIAAEKGFAATKSQADKDFDALDEDEEDEDDE